MSRLMSCSLTEPAVVARTKTVTRRLGWRFLEPGDTLTLCRKVMGRRRADGTVEPLVRLAEVVVVSVRFEPLDTLTIVDLHREGVAPELYLTRVHESPDGDVADWVAWYARTMRVRPDAVVTRIEWRYLDE